MANTKNRYAIKPYKIATKSVNTLLISTIGSIFNEENVLSVQYVLQNVEEGQMRGQDLNINDVIQIPFGDLGKFSNMDDLRTKVVNKVVILLGAELDTAQA